MRSVYFILMFIVLPILCHAQVLETLCSDEQAAYLDALPTFKIAGSALLLTAVSTLKNFESKSEGSSITTQVYLLSPIILGGLLHSERCRLHSGFSNPEHDKSFDLYQAAINERKATLVWITFTTIVNATYLSSASNNDIKIWSGAGIAIPWLLFWYYWSDFIKPGEIMKPVFNFWKQEDVSGIALGYDF